MCLYTHYNPFKNIYLTSGIGSDSCIILLISNLCTKFEINYESVSDYNEFTT